MLAANKMASSCHYCYLPAAATKLCITVGHLKLLPKTALAPLLMLLALLLLLLALLLLLRKDCCRKSLLLLLRTFLKPLGSTCLSFLLVP
jgi:hypothetical protein